MSNIASSLTNPDTQGSQHKEAVEAKEVPKATLGTIGHLPRRCWRSMFSTAIFQATPLAVTMGAALHFDSWVPNFGIQEYMRHTEETDAVFPHRYRFEDGYLHPGDAPGHGVDIDEALAARYPYKPAYLPVARLEDGTMWNW